MQISVKSVQNSAAPRTVAARPARRGVPAVRCQQGLPSPIQEAAKGVALAAATLGLVLGGSAPAHAYKSQPSTFQAERAYEQELLDALKARGKSLPDLVDFPEGTVTVPDTKTAPLKLPGQIEKVKIEAPSNLPAPEPPKPAAAVAPALAAPAPAPKPAPAPAPAPAAPAPAASAPVVKAEAPKPAAPAAPAFPAPKPAAPAAPAFSAPKPAAAPAAPAAAATGDSPAGNQGLVAGAALAAVAIAGVAVAGSQGNMQEAVAGGSPAGASANGSAPTPNAAPASSSTSAAAGGTPPNVVEARAWIANWKSKQGSDSNGDVPPNVADARRWIGNWKASQGTQ